jgi:hypothetical protein
VHRSASAAHGPANFIDGSLDSAGVRLRKLAQGNRDKQAVASGTQALAVFLAKPASVSRRLKASRPRGFIAAAMELTMVTLAERHRELVADLASPRGACANFR